MTRSVPCGVISTRVQTVRYIKKKYIVNSNGRNKVVDAQEELNKLIEDEMRALANTLTSSTAARSSQNLTDVPKSEDLWWCCAHGLGGDTAVTGNKVQVPAFGSGLGQADMGYGNVVRMVRWLVVGRPATGDMMSALAATLGPSGGVAAGSGGSGVTLACASATRSRVSPACTFVVSTL